MWERRKGGCSWGILLFILLPLALYNWLTDDDGNWKRHRRK